MKKYLTILTIISCTLMQIAFADVTTIDSVTTLETNTDGAVWRKDLPPLHGVGSRCVRVLTTAHVDLSYKTQTTNITNGINACNQTVAVGSKIKFQFKPQTSQDIYWFGTGGNWDSPYGEWVTDAKPAPGPELCSESNWIGGESGYASLSVNPPTQNITNLTGLSDCATDSSGATVCTANTRGTFNVQYTFGPTYGYFYWPQNPDHRIITDYGVSIDNSQCNYDRTKMKPLFATDSWYHPYDGTGWQICGAGTTDYMQVPQINIPCTITVGDPTDSPTTPNISGSAQCIIGSSYNFNFSSVDPKNLPLKYMIDCNNDGTFDQQVPSIGSSPGYVSSGASMTASCAYSSTASTGRTVRVMAQNSEGKTSPVGQYTFSCNNQACISGQVLVGDRCERSCDMSNACGQNVSGYVSSSGLCTPVDGTDANSSCIVKFKVSASAVNPNGSVEFSWGVPKDVGSKCGFVDLTTPTPRPIPGLQNLDSTVDRARITNVQNTTRFCLICQFYNLSTSVPYGEAVVHQWIKVIRIGEN